MSHPTEGVLRRLLDEPAGIADADGRHVVSCKHCRTQVVGMHEDARLAEAVLASEPLDLDLDLDFDAAWHRLSTATAAPSSRIASAPLRRVDRRRTTLRRPVVAAAAVAAVLVSASAAAATDWLQIFRTERIAPVGITATDLNAVPDLDAYGDVEVTGESEVHRVDGPAAAAAETGLDVPEAAHLPRGVSGEPVYQVGGEVGLTFTYSVDETARTAAEVGEPPPPSPSGLDGSRVRLVAGPGVAGVWSGSTGGPDLVVGRAFAPRAFSDSGVPFEELRDHLLSLPGLPEDVAAPLRSFGGDPSTLPLPVPSDHVTSSTAEIDGVPATVLATRDRSLAAVTWVEDGVVTVVAGPLDADEVLAVARSLR